MEAQEYDEMLRRILALTVTLGVVVERHDARMNRYNNIMDLYDTMIAELREFNRQQVVINKRLEETQAGIKALLDRMLPPSENGREA